MAQACLPTYCITRQEAQEQFELQLPFDMTLSGVSEITTHNCIKIAAVLGAGMALQRAIDSQRDIEERMNQVTAASRALSSRVDLHSIADVYAAELKLKAFELTRRAKIEAVRTASQAVRDLESTHDIYNLTIKIRN
jgi:hypothetical protein